MRSKMLLSDSSQLGQSPDLEFVYFEGWCPRGQQMRYAMVVEGVANAAGARAVLVAVCSDYQVALTEVVQDVAVAELHSVRVHVVFDTTYLEGLLIGQSCSTKAEQEGGG